MRLQTGLFCDAYNIVPEQGYVFTGVTPTYIVTGIYRGLPGSSHPPVPLTKKLTLILLDGDYGSHSLLSAVQYSGHETPVSDRPIEFIWPEGAYSHLIEVELDMKLPGSGLYDFHILVDGEPLGTVPLQIVVNVTRNN